MAINQVRVQINGTWVNLTYNNVTGKYEGTIAAPNITSFNQNDGHYYPVTVEATDLAGNVTTKNDGDSTLGNKLKLYVKETTKPTIAVTAPASDAFLTTNTPQITFQLRDETNGSGVKISSLRFILDGTTYTNTSSQMSVIAVSGGYNVTFTPSIAFVDGSHSFTIDVEDNDGNAAIQVSRSFKVDTVPPTLNVSNPASATTYINNPQLNVTGTTTDTTSGPATVTIKLNNVDQGAVTVQANGSFTKSITLANGTNTLVIRATDKAGKFSEVTRTVILDTVAPTISNVTIAPNPVNTGGSYVITVDASDV